MTAAGVRGAAKQMLTFACGGENTLRSLFDPWAPDCGETMFLPYHFWAVEHERGWVLIDCGPHPDLARDPARRLGAQAQMSDVRVGAEDTVDRCMGSAGIDLSRVTDVIATHLHYDHCGGLELLPEAVVHIQRAELDFATQPPVYQQPAYVPADWAGVTHWEIHDGEYDLFGDGAITAIPTPGHTPGHQSVIVRLQNTTVICVVDAAYHPEKMAERKLPAYLWNPDAVIASWERLEQLQGATGGTFVYSHYRVEPAAASGE